MKEVSYWDKFMHSGKIEDYLNFKSEAGKEMSKNREDSEKGDYPHAGFYCGNGDSAKGDAYR